MSRVSLDQFNALDAFETTTPKVIPASRLSNPDLRLLADLEAIARTCRRNSNPKIVTVGVTPPRRNQVRNGLSKTAPEVGKSEFAVWFVEMLTLNIFGTTC